jgi:hypothetical protein
VPSQGMAEGSPSLTDHTTIFRWTKSMDQMFNDVAS